MSKSSEYVLTKYIHLHYILWFKLVHVTTDGRSLHCGRESGRTQGSHPGKPWGRCYALTWWGRVANPSIKACV